MKPGEIELFLGRPSMSIVDALEKIDKNTRGILFITDGEQHLVGCLTDGDIRRWLIKTGNLKTDISQSMNKSPKFIYSELRDNAPGLMKKEAVTAIPIVNKNNQIVDIVFDSDDPSNMPISDELQKVPVVMMAGGKGTRLYPYTKVLPKPLIPIGDIPISERIINQFHRFGCKEFYLVVNYRKNMIKAYFNEIEKDYQVKYADEDEPLGTGGGLSLLKGQINDTFILSNCDILIQDDFTKIYKYHKEHHNKITMICSLKNYRIPYGVINLGDNGTIQSMKEKPTVSFFTNTGCYIVEPDVINHIPDKTFLGFPDIIDQYRDAGENVGVYPISEKSWLDMGQMDTLRDMQRRLVKESE
jgi:dTDP-glucose pyrophosphorylase